MIRFAFGGKWVCFSGNVCELLSPARAANKLGFSSELSAAAPMPVALRPKKCRRVINNAFSRIGSISILGQSFVEIQDHACHRGPRGEFGGLEIRVGL